MNSKAAFAGVAISLAFGMNSLAAEADAAKAGTGEPGGEARASKEWSDEMVEAHLRESLRHHHFEDIDWSIRALKANDGVSDAQIADGFFRIALAGMNSRYGTDEKRASFGSLHWMEVYTPEPQLTNFTTLAVMTEDDMQAAYTVKYYHNRKSGSCDFLRFSEDVLARRSSKMASEQVKGRIWYCLEKDVKSGASADADFNEELVRFARRHLLDDAESLSCGDRILKTLDGDYVNSELRAAAARRAEEIAPELSDQFKTPPESKEKGVKQ